MAKYSIIWIDYVLFIYTSLDEHLGCLHFLDIINNAAVNARVGEPLRKRIHQNPEVWVLLC